MISCRNFFKVNAQGVTGHRECGCQHPVVQGTLRQGGFQFRDPSFEGFDALLVFSCLNDHQFGPVAGTAVSFDPSLHRCVCANAVLVEQAVDAGPGFVFTHDLLFEGKAVTSDGFFFHKVAHPKW